MCVQINTQTDAHSRLLRICVDKWRLRHGELTKQTQKVFIPIQKEAFQISKGCFTLNSSFPRARDTHTFRRLLPSVTCRRSEGLRGGVRAKGPNGKPNRVKYSQLSLLPISACPISASLSSTHFLALTLPQSLSLYISHLSVSHFTYRFFSKYLSYITPSSYQSAFILATLSSLLPISLIHPSLSFDQYPTKACVICWFSVASSVLTLTQIA